MDASEDILRELVYGLNALLLAHHPELPDGEVAAKALLGILRDEGPRFHEPRIVEAWEEESGYFEELEFSLGETLDLVLEELSDQEEAFSAQRILELLAEEPFWTIDWGASGGQSHVPIRPPTATSLPLPLSLRRPIVAMLDQLELAVFELHTDQRSVHDRLDEGLLMGLVSATVRNLRQLARVKRIDDLPAVLVEVGPIDLGTAIAVVQRWKLAVGFDPHPDEDNGEWTMRVLERLYRIDWFIDPPVVNDERDAAPRS